MSTFISGPGNFQGIGLDPDINIRKEKYLNFFTGGRWVYLLIGILLLLFVALSIMTIIQYFNIADRGSIDSTGQIIENAFSATIATNMARVNIVVVVIVIAAFVFIMIKFITFKKWRGEQFRKDMDMARAEQESKIRGANDSKRKEILDTIRRARQRDLEAGIVGAYVGGEDIQSLELEKGKLVDKIRTLERSAAQIKAAKDSFEAEKDGIEATIKEITDIDVLKLKTALEAKEAERSDEQKKIVEKYKDYNIQYLGVQLGQLTKLKDAAIAKIAVEDVRLSEVNDIKSDVEIARLKLDTKIEEIEVVNQKREARENLDAEISRYEKSNPALAETLKLRRGELRREDAAETEKDRIAKIKQLTGLTDAQIGEAKANAQAEQKAKEDPLFRVAWEEAKKDKARKAAEEAFADREREAIELLKKSGLSIDEATNIYKGSLKKAEAAATEAAAKAAKAAKDAETEAKDAAIAAKAIAATKAKTGVRGFIERRKLQSQAAEKAVEKVAKAKTLQEAAEAAKVEAEAAEAEAKAKADPTNLTTRKQKADERAKALETSRAEAAKAEAETPAGKAKAARAAARAEAEALRKENEARRKVIDAERQLLELEGERLETDKEEFKVEEDRKTVEERRVEFRPKLGAKPDKSPAPRRNLESLAGAAAAADADAAAAAAAAGAGAAGAGAGE